MKKITRLLLAGYSIALLAGCDSNENVPCEIVSIPKTTFYRGETFSNSGIQVKVSIPGMDPITTEDVTTTKPDTTTEGTKTVKVYYTSDTYDVSTYTTYEIKVIDWNSAEKAIFNETSISNFSGVYYPKMEGLNMVTETSDEDGSIIDYWLQKPNSTLNDVSEYCELLNNYYVSKPTALNGQIYNIEYKFYEQASVPADFRDLYDLNDAVCYKYSASYEYVDLTGVLTLYGNEIEDTVVVGLDDNNNMVVRFIANSVFLEGSMACTAGEHLDFTGLFNGTALNFLNQLFLGYTDEEGKVHAGELDKMAPLAKEDFIMPNYEPDVIAVANYASMYPWLHGEDDLSFEVEIASNDTDEYNKFIAALDADTSFVKTTKTDNVRGKNVNVTVYTIEDKKYVGNLIIEVTDIIDDGVTYYSSEGTQRSQISVDCYRVYYRFQRPEIVSKAQEEVFRIYDIYYGAGNYDATKYDVYENGSIGGLVKYTVKNDGVNNATEATNKFVSQFLQGYTCTKDIYEKKVGSINCFCSEYTKDDFKVEIYAYFTSNGTYAVEFSVSTLAIN